MRPRELGRHYAAALAVAALTVAAAATVEPVPAPGPPPTTGGQTAHLLPGVPSIDAPRTTRPDRVSVHSQRVAKCAYLVRRLYPASGFAEHVEYFITEHEQAGLGEEWQWSLAYSGANFSCRCNVRARNGCAGPMDRPGGSTDAKANIKAHVREMVTLSRGGERTGYNLIKAVFLPASPRDWGGKRIWKRYHKHLRELHRGYQEGEL